MTNDNTVELLLEKAEKHVESIYSCSNEDILKMIIELKNEPEVLFQFVPRIAKPRLSA